MTPPRELDGERARWERLARDPYYAVLNEDGFRQDRAADDAMARFDRSGERDVADTLAEIRRVIDPAFSPSRALDFGCGVGRLTIPLARECGHVTGVDISQTMLDEARRNCEARQVRNVTLVTSGAFFSGPPPAAPTLDFIHSYIVFQHIPPRLGVWLADSLVGRLASGGIGALHFTYARRASTTRRIVHQLRRTIPGVNLLANVVQHRPLREPLIPMYRYDLADLFAMLRDRGCTHVHARLTDHGGHLGAMLLFQRQ
ncbi:MAG TPA: methyltransferase domain-containing protein [Gemmatimonadaceae bacterium]|nr:methyltransferase domain-containing protein [Gemmatimonadaceae bacterium]